MRDDDFLPFRLTAKEARLVAHLMKASPRAASRAELTQSVYAGAAAPRTDRIPSLVCGLRKKLAAHGVSIETKRGKGYRLSAAMAERVAAIGAAPAASAGRRARQLGAAPITPAATAPAPAKLPPTFMQGGGLRLRERVTDLARRYSLARALVAIAGVRPVETGAIEFARRRDGVFEMRR
ncbi:transcriptional regulator [Methylosinus sp. sav-2]|uniref:winged helix-turn-helix domain-containing protein n=1 Tax=Methylosinus sp. sav-2 TaxID=2485168 RepID=UPI00068FB0EF|nr:winged helix-turn-helix domain-containing protein [Methylosinus sp. sav-2]TDX60779.1 transcriptional regulator [Methylosinus sp. sav-2]